MDLLKFVKTVYPLKKYNRRNELGQTSLHCGIINKFSIEKLQNLLELGSDVNAKDIYGNTPLHVALNPNVCNMNLVKLLLKHGASVHNQNNDGQTPLHITVQYPTSIEIVHELLQYGAKLDVKDTMYRTALDLALQSPFENSAIVKKLLSSGVYIPGKNKTGETFLHVAIRYGKSLEVVRTLLEYGIDINAKDRNSNTPLHVAMNSCLTTLNLVTELLKNNASVNDRNSRNQTPLHLALETRMSLDIIKELLRHGAEVNVKDSYQNSPLFIALKTSSSNVDVIKTLLQYGAYIFEKNPMCETALHIALKYGSCLKIIHEILKYGANVNTKNASSQSPLYIAINTEPIDCDTIKLLLKYGASVHDRYTVCQIVVYILETNKLDQELINEIVRYSLIEHSDTTYCIFCDTFFSNCPKHCHYINELKKMKNDYIVDNLTLYDVLVLKKDYGKHCSKRIDVLSNPKFICKVISKYPNYYDIILNTLESKLYLIQKLCNLSVLIQTVEPTNKIIHVNSDCLREIGKYLSKDELKNFVKAIIRIY